jgi:hypothetical protein
MRIIDVTGDGLPDILQCASSSVAGYINNTHTIVNIISATHISNDHWWFPIIIALPT